MSLTTLPPSPAESSEPPLPGSAGPVDPAATPPDASLAERPAAPSAAPSRPKLVAFAGNPNAGKTTLFNALTGIRAKTANFPGTTLEARRGRMRGARRPIALIDLPGLYSLQAATHEERLALERLLGLARVGLARADRSAEPSQGQEPPTANKGSFRKGTSRRRKGPTKPDAVVFLLDATNLTRNLFLASQVLQMGLPAVAALTMMDVAEARGMKLDLKALAQSLGCRVIPVTAKTGRGMAELAQVIEALTDEGAPVPVAPPGLPSLDDLARQPLRYDWAESVSRRCLANPGRGIHAAIETMDRYATHPFWGLVGYLAVMLAVFYLIFAVAEAPMGWIQNGIGALRDWVGARLPDGDLRSLLTGGVIGGVGGVLVFLPQICLVFLCLTLLEDWGYMARAALVMDRLMRRVGLPGKAFVPMLSAHACAIPGIMAARMIEDKRDRLVTILILPLMACSARLPVYAMIVALLFPHEHAKAAMLFVGAYVLGIVSAIGMAAIFRRTILPGATQPLAIELPDYRVPSLRQALLAMWDRARMFLAKAGTIILAASVVLWWLSSYPHVALADLPKDVAAPIARLQAQAQAQAVQAAGQAAQAAGMADQARALQGQADRLLESESLARSYAGRLGRLIEPAIRPLGFDWKIGVGLISALAAREVVVSTLAILYGQDKAAGANDALYARMRAARWPGGRLVFSTAACLSLTVFFVLAMQCMATLAVVRRETGQWRWAALIQGYMTTLAWVAAFVTYQGLSALGY
jgi:ferrous iron transport protein B